MFDTSFDKEEFDVIKSYLTKHSRNRAAAIENQTNGKIFSVLFFKKDGTIRKLNGRVGVKKGVKGIGNKIDHSKYITVYDMKKKGFRNVNKDSIVAFRCGKIWM